MLDFSRFISKDFLKKNSFYILALFLIFSALVVKNFPFSSWYTGWDNLHPEFNFGLNLKRALFVWQEKGLGFMGGHGYAATLPHTLFLAFLSLFIKTKYLRSVFTFLMLFIGSAGCFYLTQNLLGKKRRIVTNIASFLAGLFYMLNLGTVQNFYIQLEAFIVHFAFLPWLLLFLILYLKKPGKKNLLIFALLSFFSSPQGFIPPLFIVYCLFLGIILLFYLLKNRNSVGLKTSFMVVLTTLVMNAYWFLPVAYYTFSGSKDYLNAYNNLHSTENFIYKNKKYGQLKDVALLKGFIFEANDITDAGVLVKILKPWIDYLEQRQVLILGYIFFSLILVGAGYFFIANKKNYKIALFFCFLLSFSALATDTPPFSYFFVFLNKLPIFKQAFRVAFTKFSISLSLFYALFFGIGVYLLIIFISNKDKRTVIKFLIQAFLTLSLIYFSWPIFAGNFVYQRTKINIPQAYFDLFEFFKKQNPNARIANFPQGWNWGWSVYKWNYSGSGFLWYGIKQSIMDRTFDVWSPQNENYYWQMVYAIYSENWSLFESLMEKHQINFLIFDKNIIPYQNPKVVFFIEDFERYLNQSKKFNLEAEFNLVNLQPIKVYRVNLKTPVKDFVFLAQNLPQINKYNWNNEDTAFQEFGHYISSNNLKLSNSNNLAFYPFRSLFTGRRQEELELEIKEGFNSFIFSHPLPKFLTLEESLQSSSGAVLRLRKGEIYLPSLTSDEAIFWTKDLRLEPAATPSVKITPLLERNTQDESGKIEVKIAKQKGYFSYDSSLDKHFLNHKAKGDGIVYKQEGMTENGKDFLRFFSLESENFFDIILDNLSHKLAYLVEIESRNVEGKSLQFAIINHDSKKTDIEISLPKNGEFVTSYFIIPPMEEYGAGYSLHFDNISIGRQKTVNDLGRVEVYPIPYRFLKQIKLISSDFHFLSSNSDFSFPSSVFQVTHPNPSFYKITVDPNTLKLSNSKTLVLSQSYHPGWKAYQILNSQFLILNFKIKIPKIKILNSHVLINNWQNGWQLNSQTLKLSNSNYLTIYLFFWPQLLEYLGFGLLIGFWGWLLFQGKILTT